MRRAVAKLPPHARTRGRPVEFDAETREALARLWLALTFLPPYPRLPEDPSTLPPVPRRSTRSAARDACSRT